MCQFLARPRRDSSYLATFSRWRFHKALLVCLAACVLLSLGLPSGAYAQTPPVDAPRGSAVIDGAVDPAAIPDDIAFLHFFHVLGPDPKAPNEQWDIARRSSYLRYFFCKTCGANGSDDRFLDDAQQKAVMAYGLKISKQISAVEEIEKEHPQGATRVQEAVTGAVRDLDNALGNEVSQKVRLHVLEHVKRQIKIVRVDIPYPKQ